MFRLIRIFHIQMKNTTYVSEEPTRSILAAGVVDNAPKTPPHPQRPKTPLRPAAVESETSDKECKFCHETVVYKDQRENHKPDCMKRKRGREQFSGARCQKCRLQTRECTCPKE